MRAAGREGAAGKALADRRRRSRYRRQRSVHRAVYAGRAGEQAARIGMGGRGEQVGGGAMFDDAAAVHDGYLVADAGHHAQIVGNQDDGGLGMLLQLGELLDDRGLDRHVERSEEHTSELQSLMSISYAVFCLKKKKIKNTREQ